MKHGSPTPRVSVIVPTYNRGWILKDAIESVLAQTFQGIELIVVDDGSTDNTPEILRGYENLISLPQANRGVSAARNRGIAHAKGSLIAFLDSDDLWQPDKLAVQIEFFEKNPAVAICQTQEIWIRNGHRINPKNRHLKASGDFFERSLALCLVSPSAVMMRRQLFDEVGFFDENLPACEDYDLWLRIGARMPISLIDAPLVVKRGGHADQLSAGKGLDKYRIRSLKNLIDSNVLSGRQKRAAIQMLDEKCSIYANGCRKRGKTEEMAFYHRLAEMYR